MKRATLAVAALLIASSASAQVRLEISGANFRPLPLAAPAPIASGVPKDTVRAFDDAWLLALNASGLFQMLDRKSFLAAANEGITAGSIQFPRWADVGAEALVKPQLAVDGDQLRGDLRLFSVGTGREELKVTEAVPASNPRQLAHLFADAVYKHFTRESGPFQSRVAFVKKSGKDREIWVSDWDGQNAKAIAGDGINVLPALSPSGAVAFTSYRGGKPDIYVQTPGGSASPLIKAGAMATGIAFSPDGKRIAWAQSSGQGTQIWVAEADGSGKRALTDTPFFINSSPAWSPDGRRLAFVSDRGGNPQIYVMNADGSGVRRLTFQGNYNQTPSWSPRGDLIAFTARDERNAFDVFTVEAATGKIARVTQDQGNNEEPTFSPNGRLLMFTTNRNGWSQLVVSTADGRNQVPLPMQRGTYVTPDWSR